MMIRHAPTLKLFVALRWLTPSMGEADVRHRKLLPKWMIVAGCVMTLFIGAAQAGKELAFPAWVQMWLTAATMFAVLKGLTLWLALGQGSTAPRVSRIAGYLFAWPGMNAEEFLWCDGVARPSLRQWLSGLIAIATGVIGIWVVPRMLFEQNQLLAGWVGQIGYVVLLHFGIFQSLTLAWKSAGVRAEPVMRQPFVSRSAGEFWGRWNTAFRDAAFALVYRPLLPAIGSRVAGAAVFVASGLIHELVISVPMGAWYGVPTGYFVLQYAAVVFERSRVGTRLGLRRGWRGRVYTNVAVWPAALLLFPPIFVERVALPFLEAIGAM
jgi:alginate O-acetyltransferase complex protein AlgI